MFNRIQRLSQKINEYAGISSGILVFLVSGTIVIYAFGRKFHDVVWFHLYYYTEFGMAWLIFISLAYALIVGAHVRVTFVQMRLPPRMRQWSNVLVHAVGVGLLGLFILGAWPLIGESIRLKERMLAPMGINIPMWIAKLSAGVGLTLLFIQFIIELIQALSESLTKVTKKE
ncbi:MAG: TRAP transporter small permease [Deltaproteobacteria bacterium]|nr:TRAP transporter small permease [Deltaproteobacteria bacterium]